MECSSKEYTSNSSAVLMSLLSEPIKCSWEPEKENTDVSNMPGLMALVPGIKDKPPIYQKPIDQKIPLELDLQLYTIPESCSEESSHRSQSDFEFTKNILLNEEPELDINKDLQLEDIEDELNICDVEKQTDLILQDLQKEQNQLSEIVNDIDKLFENDNDENKLNSERNSKDSTKINIKEHKANGGVLKQNNKDNITKKQENIVLESDIILNNNLEVSTYSDIVSILEELEKEDINSGRGCANQLPSPIQDHELPNITQKLQKIKNISTKNTCKDYEDLLSYLDQIDQNCLNTLNAAKERVHNLTELANSSIHLDAVPKLDDLLKHTNIELANYVIDLTIRLEDKTSSITLLKNEISKLHKLIADGDEDREKLIKQKILAERNKYEPVIKRHQSFIDQLIVDKKELNEKCEGLMSELKTVENRHAHNLQAAEQRHRIEVRRSKDMFEAAEKGKREKWMEAKTAKIKEMTIKSVEHDMVSMAEKYQREISELKLTHKREIEELELRAARKTQQQCETLREQLTMERESAIANEREALRQRFEKLVESEERSYQEQKRRMKEEHVSRLNELKNRERVIEEERDSAIKIAREECEERLVIAQRRQDIQINNLKESSRLELEMWKNNYIKQQNIKLTDIEARIREMCKKERDREIELVIDKLERESEEIKQKMELSSENKLRRLKEKYEEEIRMMDKTEHDNKDRLERMKFEIIDQEKIISKLQKTVSELHEERSNLKKISDDLTTEKKNLRNIIKQEFLAEINELKNEVNNHRVKKEKELQDIYSRVKLSMARKDEQIKKITDDNITLHEKCKLLENMLEKQRRDYLIR